MTDVIIENPVLNPPYNEPMRLVRSARLQAKNKPRYSLISHLGQEETPRSVIAETGEVPVAGICQAIDRFD